MAEYSKHIKRLLKELAAEAYEKELSRELAKLEKGFVEWRDGTINSSELSHRIYEWEVGPSRELYKKYNDGQNDFNVAYAIVTGMLNREAIPKELIEEIDKHIRFYQGLKDSGELIFSGE